MSRRSMEIFKGGSPDCCYISLRCVKLTITMLTMSQQIINGDCQGGSLLYVIVQPDVQDDESAQVDDRRRLSEGWLSGKRVYYHRRAVTC